MNPRTAKLSKLVQRELAEITNRRPYGTGVDDHEPGGQSPPGGAAFVRWGNCRWSRGTSAVIMQPLCARRKVDGWGDERIKLPKNRGNHALGSKL